MHRSWANGYDGVGGRRPYEDYGSADGCPPYGSCNNGWSQATEYALSWGIAAAHAVPEIYWETGGNATQWQRISLWGVTSGQKYGKIWFDAPMTQYNACHSSQSNLAYCTSNHVDNLPVDAWTQLTNAVQSDSRTSVSIRMTTDINWH